VKILPNAENVVIPKKKFSEYALNSEAEPDKAIAFDLALGYTIDDVDKLIENIRKNVAQYDATYKGYNGYGETYQVIMKLTGENGKIAKVLTGWIVDDETHETRLTTAHIDD
jgi:hypothetical protein